MGLNIGWIKYLEMMTQYLNNRKQPPHSATFLEGAAAYRWKQSKIRAESLVQASTIDYWVMEIAGSFSASFLPFPSFTLIFDLLFSHSCTFNIGRDFTPFFLVAYPQPTYRTAAWRSSKKTRPSWGRIAVRSKILLRDDGINRTAKISRFYRR